MNKVASFPGLLTQLMSDAIGQCEGSKSLRGTIPGLYMKSAPPQGGLTLATTILFMDTLKKMAGKNTVC